MLRDKEVARWYGQDSQGSRKTDEVYSIDRIEEISTEDCLARERQLVLPTAFRGVERPGRSELILGVTPLGRRPRFDLILRIKLVSMHAVRHHPL